MLQHFHSCIQTGIEAAVQPEPPETLPGTARNLAAAALLAVCGGMLDATVYLLHGHVFATAMTGNAVLMGIALLAHDDRQALRHLLPLVTFTCGILLGWGMLRRVKETRRVHRLALLIQMAALAVAGAAPAHFPSDPIVLLIALTASVQIATFQRIDSVAYNTTFVTGNIRTLLEAAYDTLFADREKAMRQLRAIMPVCAGFFLGVLAGAALAPHAFNHSLWAAGGVLLAAFLLLG